MDYSWDRYPTKKTTININILSETMELCKKESNISKMYNELID